MDTLEGPALGLIFPSQPFEGRVIDEDFSLEYEAARRVGFEVGLYSLEEKRLLTPAVSGSALYRGWMMTADEYGAFYDRLHSRGTSLLTSPEQYRFCHHLADWYETLVEETPKSVIFKGPNFDWERLTEAFPSGPLILKDYVKSCKHYWEEACFIGDLDFAKVSRVTERFLELRGEFLEGGLVFRECLSLLPIGVHPQSNLPLTLEYRVFVFKGKILGVGDYWPQGEYGSHQRPPESWLQTVIEKIGSPFFALDVALDTDGRWWVIEVGDGQVSGLNDAFGAEDFYRRLAVALR